MDWHSIQKQSCRQPSVRCEVACLQMTTVIVYLLEVRLFVNVRYPIFRCFYRDVVSSVCTSCGACPTFRSQDQVSPYIHKGGVRLYGSLLAIVSVSTISTPRPIAGKYTLSARHIYTASS